MNASINSILDPLDILRELSISRSWDDQTPLSWEQGTLGNISGRKLEHSAYFYVTRKNRFLNHRIWAAQASVLLPIIEQKRLSLLPKIRHYLDLPFDTGYATISDPNDLEIGYLFYQLNRNGADPAIRQTVRRLKEVRNALSHLEPLSVSELLDDNLYDPTV